MTDPGRGEGDQTIVTASARWALLLCGLISAGAVGATPPSSEEIVRRLSAAADARARDDHQAVVDELRIVRSSPHCNVQDHVLLATAEAHLALGDVAEALVLARVAPGSVERSVRVADAAWLEARCLSDAGRHAEAAVAWKAFVERHGKDSRARQAAAREAEALEQAGDLGRAARAWHDAWLEQPADTPEDAIDRARRLAASAGVTLPEATARQLRDRADALAKRNRHARAVEGYRLAEAAYDGGAGTDLAMIRRARSEYRLRENEAARSTARSVVERFPRTEYATVSLHVQSRVAWRLDEGDRLLELTRQALVEPRHRHSSWRDDVLYVRGGYFMEQERWDDAVTVFERLVADHPRSNLAHEVRWKLGWSRFLQGRHDEAARRFRSLAENSDRKAMRHAGRFWEGRALRAAGKTDAARRAWVDLYESAPHSYYGARAREDLAGVMERAALEALDREVAAGGHPFQAPPAPDLEATVHGQRYATLARAGWHAAAVGELEAHRRRVGGDSPALTLELARARSAAGRARQGAALINETMWRHVKSPSREGSAALWEVLYPMPWRDLVEREARRQGIDPSLCAAIIRSESWWTADVRSSADARGLMQLIPETGRRVAALEGVERFDPEQLFDPELNVRLGVRYLSDLVSMFGGDVAAAVASYNAGEKVVGEWWAAYADEGIEDPAERIERIPYVETRGYVKKVLEAAGWYRWLAADQDGRSVPAVAGTAREER